MEATYTVTELSRAIGRTLARAFPDELWVEGEIKDLSRSRNGHVYFTLVDPDSGDDQGQPAAVLPVTLFATDRGAVNRVLMRTGAVRMTNGVHVRIRGRVTHYPGRGTVQLRMSWIDTEYTIGRLAAERIAVLRRLDAAGLLEANARLPLPGVPLEVGVVTSIGSAAHADFLAELAGSGYAFTVTVVDARTQGPEAVTSLVRALDVLAMRGCAVAALVRGGGAQTDLAAFDDETLARTIALAPFPVLTGIGHEVDTTVADRVANRSLKTPTACAQALVAMVRAFEQRLDGLAAATVTAAVGGAQQAATGLGRRSGRLATATRLHLTRHGRSIDAATAAIGRRAPLATARASGATLRLASRTATATRHALTAEERRLDGLAAIQRTHDPGRMLARGWTLTYRGDRLVRRPGDVAPGDHIRTETAGGGVRSVVEEGDGEPHG